MVVLIVAIVFAIVGFFAANVVVGKKAEKKVRHVKAVRPVLSIEDKIMMRAGYASYHIISHYQGNEEHFYLATMDGTSITPVYEIIMDGENVSLYNINEEHVYA